MVKNRRNKVVSLTQVNKKGQKNKDKLMEDIRSCCETYKNVFVFSVRNMRNNKFKDMRMAWQGSRFFMGKNKVMSHALGANEANAHRPGTNLLVEQLKGNNVGIFFTNSSDDEVIEYFNTYEEPNFARSGFKCTYDFSLQRGT